MKATYLAVFSSSGEPKCVDDPHLIRYVKDGEVQFVIKIDDDGSISFHSIRNKPFKIEPGISFKIS